MTKDRSYLGKVVRVQVAPPGSVLGCRVASSEPKVSELKATLLARIRMVDFSTGDVAQIGGDLVGGFFAVLG
ncbi:MAG: hypothetical protein IPF55_16745 [Rhodoferax sp.]|nr:hypothetical protein [Rhodoferax sp.]